MTISKYILKINSESKEICHKKKFGCILDILYIATVAPPNICGGKFNLSRKSRIWGRYSSTSYSVLLEGLKFH